MGIFKKMGDLFKSSGRVERNELWVTVKCRRCGEVIRGRIDMRNELSLDYDEDGKMRYVCRKVLIGDQRCFQPVEVVLTFDADRRLVDRQITGGEFVD
jgi:hypothetical protein